MFRGSHHQLALPSSTSQKRFGPARRILTTLRKEVVLLARFEFGGDQTNFVDSRNAHDINGPRHLFEETFVIALDESAFFRPLLKNLPLARTMELPAGIFLF